MLGFVTKNEQQKKQENFFFYKSSSSYCLTSTGAPARRGCPARAGAPAVARGPRSGSGVPGALARAPRPGAAVGFFDFFLKKEVKHETLEKAWVASHEALV